jgi:hypothetical protein
VTGYAHRPETENKIKLGLVSIALCIQRGSIMCWLQAYANYVPHKSSGDFGFIKKEFRSHGLSAYHSSNYLVIHLLKIYSMNIFSTHSHAIPSLYHSQTIQANHIGGS